MNNIPTDNIRTALESFLETEREQAEGATSYSSSHKKYYERYKALIFARSRKYQKAYKHAWYKRNRDRILAERRLKKEQKGQMEFDFTQK